MTELTPDGYVDFTLKGRYPVHFHHYRIEDEPIASMAEAIEIDKTAIEHGDLLPEDLLTFTDIVEVHIEEVIA